MEPTADVAVVGAGPAGAAAALMLAPDHRVLLVDRLDAAAPPAARIGESLPGAARRLLRDMGLWEAFLAEGHVPRHGADSLWGGPDLVSAESLRDLDGPGWHLDRARFDAWLRDRAVRRGAALVAPARLAGLARDGAGWRLVLIRHGRELPVRARFVIEAGGRAAPVARALGLARARHDRLICRWLHGRAAGEAGRSFVAAEPDGWWYSAALPGGRRVLAFHTDADLAAARETAGAAALLARARMQPGLSAILAATGFAPDGPPSVCAAHGGRPATVAGPGWLAVGDAALACDPLSSQGLLNALYSALMAADAVRAALAGEADASEEYRRTIGRVAHAYRDHLAAWYDLEDRWPAHPFWARRRTAGQGVGAAGRRPERALRP
ncbi:flavin-dependent dehydrogenase [Methylorubrum rhodinum]|uniref:Flavin-dependent dehydrogenase n=1 Tax=Methylorubrum rhodinum TaxID=29428 RepID=A0A840ZG22_9HYPH|nr:FAD-dependent monooxygenase [Methylorubrum rhodinum]MBB5756128.1 flavin-dependent dehydrogenase [Methylorubrum rhodinum]